MSQTRQQKVIYLHLHVYNLEKCDMSHQYRIFVWKELKTPAKSNLTAPSAVFMFYFGGRVTFLTSQEYHVPAEFSFKDAKTLKVLEHFPHMHCEALSDLGPAQPADVQQ